MLIDEEICFEPALKGILVLVHVTKVCLQLVRMRNIVVTLIELFWKKKECWWLSAHIQHLAMLILSTVQPTPECLYHTFTYKTPCTLYNKKSKKFQLVKGKVISPFILQKGLYSHSIVHRIAFCSESAYNQTCESDSIPTAQN